jgi:hypothetical protein
MSDERRTAPGWRDGFSASGIPLGTIWTFIAFWCNFSFTAPA